MSAFGGEHEIMRFSNSPYCVAPLIVLVCLQV
jgi:hypothetical protein